MLLHYVNMQYGSLGYKHIQKPTQKLAVHKIPTPDPLFKKRKYANAYQHLSLYKIKLLTPPNPHI